MNALLKTYISLTALIAVKISIVSFGLLIVINHKKLSDYWLTGWHKTYPNTKIKIWEKGINVIFINSGIIIIIIGFLTLFKIITFQGE